MRGGRSTPDRDLLVSALHLVGRTLLSESWELRSWLTHCPKPHQTAAIAEDFLSIQQERNAMGRRVSRFRQHMHEGQ